MSNSWKLPTGFYSNFPDSVNIDLTGYLTGPGLEYETAFLNGSVHINGLTEVRINSNLANYELEKQNYIFIQADYNTDHHLSTHFILFTQDENFTLIKWHCSDYKYKQQTIVNCHFNNFL